MKQIMTHLKIFFLSSLVGSASTTQYEGSWSGGSGDMLNKEEVCDSKGRESEGSESDE